MRYGSLPNSKKQPSDSQRGRETSCFHIKAWLFCLLLCTLSSPGVCQHPSSFCSVTLSLLGAYQAAMSHLKEDSNTFHITSNTLILGSSYGRTSTSRVSFRSGFPSSLTPNMQLNLRRVEIILSTQCLNDILTRRGEGSQVTSLQTYKWRIGSKPARGGSGVFQTSHMDDPPA